MKTRSASSAAVSEVLDDVDNYLDWSVQVKTYLIAQDLWDIIEPTPKPEKVEAAFKAWTKKNAKSLHMIQLSCGPRFRCALRMITSAKTAWDALEKICSYPKSDYEPASDDSDDESYGDWSKRMESYMNELSLLDIVIATTNRSTLEDDGIAFKDWSMKNALALYLILASFGSKADTLIGKISEAKIAWDTLAEKYDSDSAHSIQSSRSKNSAERFRLNMETSAAVSKVLDIDNYFVWSVQVRTYLIAQDLWNIVEATEEPCKQENDEAASKAWTKKNAMALHVIQISCEPHICFAIGLITSAKIAWDTLEAICSLPKPKSIDSVFDEESYVAWSVPMKAYLMELDLWDIVEATTEPPTPKNDEITFKDWSRKNALALYLIRESSRSKAFPLIGKISTAKIAWDTLAEIYKLKNMEDFNQYASFHKNVHEGNWDFANQFLSSHPEAVNAKSSFYGDTALHIAVISGHMNIVEELVNKMSEENLKIKNKDCYTALGLCAQIGNIEMAKCIIGKCRTLLSIGNSHEQIIPVVLAIRDNPNAIDMVRYFYDETPKEDLMPEKGVDGATFITQCIYGKAFDFALDLLQRFPALALALDVNNETPLLALASVSFAYPSGNRLIFWKQWIYDSIPVPSVYATNEIPISIKELEKGERGQARNIGSGINEIYELKLLHHQSKKLLRLMCQSLLNSSPQKASLACKALAKAIKNGRVEFVTAIMNANYLAVFTVNKSTKTNIFMLAVVHRQNEVFQFLCGFLLKNKILSVANIDGNNILHMAATLEPSARRNTIPGAAFLMQREAQWFKKVESIVQPFLLEAQNLKGQTPQELFRESHKELVKEGEKWMKETATSCTVAGALIVTIIFAAAITVPGGNNQNTGLPMFFNEKLFKLFIISDALSLLSASTSLLMFIGILTARYAEEDFLKSLPNKMIIGLSTLIFSIATMMITFCASLFIILPRKSRMLIPLVCLAGVPVVVFAWMQFGLLIDMVISTYRPGIILDKKVKRS